MIEILYEGGGSLSVLNNTKQISFDMMRGIGMSSTDHVLSHRDITSSDQYQYQGTLLRAQTHTILSLASIDDLDIYDGSVDVLICPVPDSQDYSAVLKCIQHYAPSRILPRGVDNELNQLTGTKLAMHIMQQGVATPKVLRPGQMLALT